MLTNINEINTANNNNNDVIVNNNYELKFPYSIKSVDPNVNTDLLKDFTGLLYCSTQNKFYSSQNKIYSSYERDIDL